VPPAAADALAGAATIVGLARPVAIGKNCSTSGAQAAAEEELAAAPPTSIGVRIAPSA